MAVATYSPHAKTTGSWLSHNPFSSRYTLSSTRGIAKSNAPERRCARLEELLAWVEVIPFGTMQSRCAAWIRAEGVYHQPALADTGIGDADGAIAQRFGVTSQVRSHHQAETPTQAKNPSP